MKQQLSKFCYFTKLHPLPASTDKLEMRLLIIITNIIGIASSLPCLIMLFGGGAETGLMFLFLPMLLILAFTTFVITLNAKKGYKLNLLCSFIIVLVLVTEIFITPGITFDDTIFIISPLFVYLILIAVETKFLFDKRKEKEKASRLQQFLCNSGNKNRLLSQ